MACYGAKWTYEVNRPSKLKLQTDLKYGPLFCRWFLEWCDSEATFDNFEVRAAHLALYNLLPCCGWGLKCGTFFHRLNIQAFQIRGPYLAAQGTYIYLVDLLINQI